MKDSYSRNNNIPKAGFTRGPCLLKDTMQLSSFYNHKFSLGHVAMLVNEGIPQFIINNLKRDFNLKNKTVGLLGLTFKADSDDTRDSLAIKLLALLKKRKIKTLYSDEYCKMKGMSKRSDLVKKSDIIIISTPHKIYKRLKIPKHKKIVDIWGFR